MSGALRLSVLSLLSLLAVGCGGYKELPGPLQRPRDGGHDASPDLAKDGAATDADGPDANASIVDAPGADAPPECSATSACAPDHFCGGGRCISAVTAVAAGSGHTCALHKDGRVSCWGYGKFIGPDLPAVSGPVFVTLPEAAEAIAVGAEAACALLQSGRVRCWGELGGKTVAPSEIVRDDGSPLGGVSQIAGGTVAFCGMGAAGIHCWGDNKASELGRPATETFPATTAVLVDARPRALIAATVAILVYDGTAELCGWGNNDSGLLPGPRGIVEKPVCSDKAGKIVQLAAGDGHACALRGGDSFACWGTNSGGQLGTGDDSLLDVEFPGPNLKLPEEIASITTGGYHTCALLKSGGIMCWGSNEHGECGVPTSAPIFAPIVVPGAKEGFIAIGSGAEAFHTCAIRAGGAVACWGSDERGQLGGPARTEDPNRHSATPIDVVW